MINLINFLEQFCVFVVLRFSVIRMTFLKYMNKSSSWFHRRILPSNFFHSIFIFRVSGSSSVNLYSAVTGEIRFKYSNDLSDNTSTVDAGVRRQTFS